ncbi:MAG: hypothetical protein OXU20_14190 [Myxococcales bacterium]|nr:hypothetical protein [Myxococcales bacterium]
MRRLSAYRVFLTKNSEYHVRGGTCVCVRDRRTGRWLAQHATLGRPLADYYIDGAGELRSGHVPMIGDPLTFAVDDQSVVTSAILSIEVREDVHAGLARYEWAVSRRPALSPRDTY